MAYFLYIFAIIGGGQLHSEQVIIYHTRYRSLPTLLLYFLATTSAHITDYSRANYIPVIDGKVLVWEEFAYVRHSANLSEYRRVIDETDSMLDMFPQSHMKKLLSVDIAHLRDMLDSLSIHHRVARSLDFLGTALKVVAGTPDAEDFEKVKFTEARLVDAHNSQIEINTKTQVRINELTDTINKLLKISKSAQIDTGHLYETLSTRNRIIVMELQNLMLTITLAKINVVSPNFLDHADLESIWGEEPTNTPIREILSVASVKVLQSLNILHFIIKFPKIIMACNKVTILPVVHHDTVLRLKDNVVAECNREIRTVKNCSITPGATFCQLSSVSSCAQELHAGVVAHCDAQQSDLHPITYVDEGIIVINDRPALVRVDNGTAIHIRGTHLITFIESAMVNETVFFNHDMVQNRAPGVANSPVLNISMKHEVLSLPYLHRLSEKNLEQIRNFEKDVDGYRLSQIALVAGAIFCALICIGLTWQRTTRAKKSTAQLKEVLAQIGSAEGGLNLEEGIVN